MKLRSLVYKCLNILLLLIVFQINAFNQTQLNWEMPFSKCWEVPVNADLTASIASDNNNIFFTDNNRTLISFNIESGKENWRSILGGKFKQTLILDKNSIFTTNIPGTDTKNNISDIRSINIETGITNWQFEISIKGELNILQNQQQIFLIDSIGQISSINKTNGNKIWTKSFSSNTISDIFSHLNLLKILMDNQVSQFSLNNEKIENNYQKSNQTVILNNNLLISGDSKGNIICFDLKRKKNQWNIKVGGGISNLVNTENGLLVTSLDNFVYFFSIRYGQLIWRKRVAGRINIAPLVKENYAVIVNSNNNIATIIDIKSGKTVNKIQINDNDYFTSFPILTDYSIIFRTLKEISAFSNKNCQYKKAGNN